LPEAGSTTEVEAAVADIGADLDGSEAKRCAGDSDNAGSFSPMVKCKEYGGCGRPEVCEVAAEGEGIFLSRNEPLPAARVHRSSDWLDSVDGVAHENGSGGNMRDLCKGGRVSDHSSGLCQDGAASKDAGPPRLTISRSNFTSSATLTAARSKGLASSGCPFRKPVATYETANKEAAMVTTAGRHLDIGSDEAAQGKIRLSPCTWGPVSGKASM